jgi:SAM-dependent methyltransferase
LNKIIAALELGTASNMKINNSKCPLCSNTKCRKMNVYSDILNLPGNIASDVFYCTACGAYFLWPYISDELISELYAKSYFTGVSENGNSCVMPASGKNYESEQASARIEKFHLTLKMLLTYVPEARNILDIGAAFGEFLSIAKEHGLSVSGIELSSHACGVAKDKYCFNFKQVRVEDYHGNEKYDLIHINHVFEHFVSPHIVLERINSLLSPGGMVYVEVPFQFNLFEVMKYRLHGQRKKFDAFSVHHPVFYRPRTLKNIFDAHGFNCRKIRIFDWPRYPVVGLESGLKRLIWSAASLLGQGVFIEALFDRKR